MADAKVCDICKQLLEVDQVKIIPFKVYDWSQYRDVYDKFNRLKPKYASLKDTMYKIERTRELEICAECYDEYHTWLVEFIASKIRPGVLKTYK